MAFNGSGTFVKNESDFVNGTTIDETVMNSLADDIVGGLSACMTLAGEAPMTGALDLNGQELILDADGDTTITSDTDDQIDIKIAGADDFQLTANTFTALSGSTIKANTIAETTAGSGVTIDSFVAKDGGATSTVSGTVVGLTVANTGTGNGIFLNQDGNGIALNIDSEQTSGKTVQVSSTSSDYNMQLTDQHATTVYTLRLESTSSPDDNTSTWIRCEDGTTLRAICYSDGDWANHDGTYGSISDQKLKQDFSPAASYWNDFKALKYQKYRMKSDVAQYGADCDMRLGLIAQEVEQIFPSCVRDTPDMEEVVVETVERPAIEEIVIPPVIIKGKVVVPERRERRQKIVDGRPVVEVEKVKEQRQKLDAHGNPEFTKVVKSSIIDGTIAAVVLQEAMRRIEILEAQVSSLQTG